MGPMNPATDIDALATAVQGMTRADLIRAVREVRCPFPVDFTDDFLAQCALERLKHYVLALLIQSCRRPA